MIGCLIFGSLAAMGLARAIHHRRWCGGGGWYGGGWGRHGHGHGWHGHGPWGDGGWGSFDRGEPESDGGAGPFGGAYFGEGGFPGLGGRRSRGGKRFIVRQVLEHLRATPAQERVIAAAVDEFRDELGKVGGGEARRSRQEIVEALRRPTFDGVMLGEQFARHDTAIEGGRKAFVGLMAKIHDALEPDQRARLADLVERGPRLGDWARGWRGGW